LSRNLGISRRFAPILSPSSYEGRARQQRPGKNIREEHAEIHLGASKVDPPSLPIEPRAQNGLWPIAERLICCPLYAHDSTGGIRREGISHKITRAIRCVETY